MSMYAFFQSNLLPRLQRKFFGTKVDRGDGTQVDTGVEEFKQELLSALGSEAPIKLKKPIELTNYMKDTPAIIIRNIHGDGPGIRVEHHNEHTTVNVTNVTTVSEDGDQSPVSLEVLTDVSASVSVSGCDATISITKTYRTIRFTGSA